MTEEQLYKGKIEALVSAIFFTNSAVTKQIDILNEDINNLGQSIADIKSKGAKVPEEVMAQYKTKKKILEKTENDADEIEDLINNINAIRSNTSLSEEIKFERLNQIISPFFKEYENEYDSSFESVAIKNGESQFKKIIKTTSTYAKLSKKIDKLEQKAAVLSAKNISKGSKKLYRRQERTFYKIRDLKNKQVAVKSKQKIIMLKRQEMINKKNVKISKLEARAELYNKWGKSYLAAPLEAKIDQLKTKKVKVKAPGLLLLKERVIDFIKKKTFDENGNYDYRSWEERRATELEKKSGRKL